MSEATPVITAREFEERLVALCAGGTLLSLPRRQRDVAIVLASCTLWMEPGTVYTEAEINAGLRHWLDSVCLPLRLDEVTLRRELIDRVYLSRDDAGTHYSLGPGPPDWRFEDSIASTEPGEVVAAARSEREARKRAHLERDEGK